MTGLFYKSAKVSLEQQGDKVCSWKFSHFIFCSVERPWNYLNPLSPAVTARKHRDNGLDSANDIPKIRYKVIKILVFMNEDKNLISQNLSHLNCSVSFEAPID